MTPHPWLAEFAADPDKGLSDLLHSYAEIGSLTRCNAPDAAHHLFNGLPTDDPLRSALDHAVLRYLQTVEVRCDGDDEVFSERDIAMVCDALSVVMLLQLPDTAERLRLYRRRWGRIASELPRNTGSDARAALWYALALTQPLLARTAPEIGRLGLIGFWLSICDGSSQGLFPSHYEAIGVRGLECALEAWKISRGLLP